MDCVEGIAHVEPWYIKLRRQRAPLRAHAPLRADEFAAHAGAVNCLKIGRKSSGVLVTGGDDKKINVWAIGKPNAILVRRCRAGHPPERREFERRTTRCLAGVQ